MEGDMAGETTKPNTLTPSSTVVTTFINSTVFVHGNLLKTP
jgi:hypothetical protein